MARGGATKTEGGKTYIQSSSGMWVDKNSSAGDRVSSSVGGSSGSSSSSSGGYKGSSGGSWIDPNIYPKGVAKVGKDGVVRYPDGSLAGGKLQAHFDWSSGRNGRDYRDPNGSDEYNREYDRYMTLKPGDDWTGGSGGYGYDGDGGYYNTDAMGSYLGNAYQAQLDAIRARTDQAVNQVAGQQSGIRQNAEEGARQAYINNQLQGRDINQQLSASGQSGGAAESTLLGMNTNYENNRNEILQNRDNALQENVNQQNMIRATGDASLAESENAYAMLLEQQRQEQERYDRERADRLNDVQSERDWQLKLAAQQSAKSASKGTSGVSKPRLTYDQTQTEIENGNRSPQVLDAYDYYTGTPYQPKLSESGRAFDSAMQRNLNGKMWQHVTDTQKANDIKNAIESAFYQGSISKEDAEYLAKQYGFQ